MTDRPWSEIFKEAADDWVDKQAAADLLEETKTPTLAQRASMLGDIAVNKAEQTIKASQDWHEHLEKIVVAKRDANKARMQLEYIRMRFSEWNNEEANHRAGARL